MPFARIAITLPKELLAAADRRAKELDRSRSRVIAEALRAYVASSPTRVSEPGVALARTDQLERDLARTPAERLHRAEAAARLATQARPRSQRGARHQIIGFDSYEDFYEWKKTNRA